MKKESQLCGLVVGAVFMRPRGNSADLERGPASRLHVFGVHCG
jgi:hypothetical protein